MRGALIGLLVLILPRVAVPTSGIPQDVPTKRVVVLYSAPLDFPATEMTERGIRNGFLASTAFHVQLFSEYLDLSRFRKPQQREALSALLRSRYADEAIDLIISVDVPAARFLLENAQTVFPKIPIVMCSIPEILADQLAGSPLRQWASAALEPTDATHLVETALALRPDTKTIALISGAYENDVVRAAGLRRTIQALGERYRLVALEGLPIEDVIAALGELPRETIIFFSTLFVDGKGRSFIPRNALRILSEAAEAPLFGLYESYLGYGIVGGTLISLERQGRKAAEMGLRVLAGTPPAAIPFDNGLDTCVSAYDWRQLKRWRIAESRLPPGSTVHFRELSMWDQYRSYIIGFSSLLAVQSALILMLVINLQRRKRAEVALRESRQDLKTLAGRLISSQEEELRRLSREFHDDIAQRLAAVAIEAGTLELRSPHVADEIRAKIRHIKEQLIGLSEDVTTISRQIHPAILKDLGLVRAIDSLRLRFSDREGIEVDFQSGTLPGDLSPEVSLCLYRITQESLRNVAKHSKASRVEITLQCHGRDLFLRIIDDGIGFEPKNARLTPGIGLASMRERIQYLNGTIRIHSEPGMGTLIEVSVPHQREKV